MGVGRRGGSGPGPQRMGIGMIRVARRAFWLCRSGGFLCAISLPCQKGIRELHWGVAKNEMRKTILPPAFGSSITVGQTRPPFCHQLGPCAASTNRQGARVNVCWVQAGIHPRSAQDRPSKMPLTRLGGALGAQREVQPGSCATPERGRCVAGLSYRRAVTKGGGGDVWKPRGPPPQKKGVGAKTWTKTLAGGGWWSTTSGWRLNPTHPRPRKHGSATVQ